MISPLRIAIDGTMISSRPKGVSRYLTNLLAHLSAIDHANGYSVFVDSRVSTSSLPKSEQLSYRPVEFRSNLHWKLFALRKLLSREHFDLVHLPSESRAVATPCPCVVTVHEIAQTKWKLEKGVSPYQLLSQLLNEWHFRRNINKAKAIIAVSQATKDELISLYRVEAPEITVIHEAPDPRLLNGIGEHTVDKIRSQFGARQGFVLSFATGDCRENVEAVLVAFHAIHDRVPHQLILCGTRPLTEERLRERCRALGIMDRVSILGFVDDSVLACLYAAADLYVDISFYEGFGLQACEAIACGVPVIASRIPAFVEVLGMAADFVAVEDVTALALSMQRILSNRDEWERRSRLGKERARAFSWGQAAEQTVGVYRRAAKTN